MDWHLTQLSYDPHGSYCEFFSFTIPAWFQERLTVWSMGTVIWDKMIQGRLIIMGHASSFHNKTSIYLGLDGKYARTS